MIGASSIETALEAVLSQDIDARLLRVKKAVVAVEAGDLKATHRLNQRIREVLKSVKSDPKILPSQKEAVADLFLRQRKFDPRRAKIEGEKEQEEEREAAEAAPIDSEEHRQFLASNYVPGEWYMAHRAPANDSAEFEHLLKEEQKKLAVCTEPEWLVFQDKMVRDLVSPPCSDYGFTVDGLQQYEHALRGPWTHNGVLTHGGKMRAEVLLYRDRLIAGKCAPADRKPDLTKLKDYLSPLAFELLVQRA